MCVQPAHYQDWLAFKRYSIESVERGECREHRYHHNIENCARWQPYSPYKQAEADTGSFTDNRNDNNYNDKNASYFPMPNVFLIFVIVSLKMLYWIICLHLPFLLQFDIFKIKLVYFVK